MAQENEPNDGSAPSNSSISTGAESARAGVSRRRMMQSAAVVVGAPAFALVSAPIRKLRTEEDVAEWDAALAVWKDAHRKADAVSGKCDQIASSFETAVKKVPHITVGYDRAGKPVSTADEFMLADARRTVRDVVYLENCPGNYDRHRMAQKLLDAHEERLAEIKHIDARLGYSAAADACDAAWDREGAAKSRLMKMPAPNQQAALWKLEELFGAKHLNDEDGAIPLWTVDYVGQFFDDVRRFLVD